MNKIKITNISIRNRNKETLRLQRAKLLAGIGIEGDKNAKGGDRQLSFLPEHVRRGIDNGEVTGLCLPRFTENITYDGEEILQVGVRYGIGDALVEISPERKKCFPECKNVMENKSCILMKYISYAKIISSGEISVNIEMEAFEGE